MQKLTLRQNQILQFIQQQIESTGFPPTRVEIAQAFGFHSPNAAEQHLKALARKKAIELIQGTSRGIRLVKNSSALKSGLPVIGAVAAGQPILAEEYIEDFYPLSPNLFQPSADYLLRVRGMSMSGIGILEGDLLAVHQTTEVQNGQVVVARVGNEITVKRFQQYGYEIRLLSENQEYKPIFIDLRTQIVIIEGLGVGIIRTGKPL